MSRPARPAALKLLNGRSAGRDSGGRPVVAPPSFVRVAPKPPTWLSAEAKAEWRRVVPELDRLNILKGADRAVLACYCEAWSIFVGAQRKLGRHGSLTIEARQGVIPHPAVAIARNAQKELRAWCHELGLSPSAESRINALPQAVDVDEDFD